MLVEEAAAAAESMQEQAQSLTEAVSVFKLVQGETTLNEKPKRASVTEPPIERRAPTRAKNVTRLPAKAEAKPAANLQARAKTGTDDDKWSEF